LALPPILRDNAGAEITADQWPQRRQELLELFRENIYGRTPVQRPDDLRFELVDTRPDAMDGAATRQLVNLLFSGPGGSGSIRLILFIPNTATPRQPAPSFLLVCHRDPENIDPTREHREDFWPAEEIVASGFAAAAFHVSDVDPDEHDEFQNGVHGIFDPPRPGDTERPGDAWGTIAAWSWGASRALDYLLTQPRLDPDRVAVVGHSRGGKTALWAGARDTRFALAISNNSGCTGAALARGKRGERVARINRAFPHWFCENYTRFNHKESQLPVDQHMLIALMAPRLVYVASASQDDWADPRSEFRSCKHAAPAFELLGLTGLGSEDMPPPDQPLHSGSIGYHLRSGPHDLTLTDWQHFMDFAQTHGW
jgi:pimeloyl-ACP methyl ester carboxylesterase